MHKEVSLYFKEGSSDKIYQASIENVADGYMVNFAYGRRGQALNLGSKTKAPVDLAKAEKIYTKLVSSKLGKGYREQGRTVPIQSTGQDGEDSGIRCQLLNFVPDEAHRDQLIASDEWLAQEKKDGERRLIQYEKDSSPKGINRRGKYVPLPKRLSDIIVRHSPHGFIIDGEIIGEEYFVFDILEINGNSVRHLPFSERFNLYTDLVQHYWKDPKERKARFKKVYCDGNLKGYWSSEQWEGIVFKKADAPYTPGRPASGGTQLKYKFWNSATVMVSGHSEDRRSVSMVVFEDEGGHCDVGNVTIPPNHQVPAVGSIIEVRYLYIKGAGGSLFQPVYLGIRPDMDRDNCKTGQLVYQP